MQAVDTNIWARAYLNDDAHQARVARAAIDAACVGEGLFVSDIVLAEIFWVLSLAWDRDRVLRTLEHIFVTRGVVLESLASAEHALQGALEGGAGFADRLILATALNHGASEVLTFDRAFARLPHVRKLI